MQLVFSIVIDDGLDSLNCLKRTLQKTILGKSFEIFKIGLYPNIYFRTLIGNIFLGVCFVKARKSRLQAYSIREETVLQRSFGIFKILKHPLENILSLLSILRNAFVMEVLV